MGTTEFRRKCGAVIAEVERTGEPVIILKRGKPHVKIVPLPLPLEQYLQYRLRGSAEIVGDIIEPPLPADAWDANRCELLEDS